MRDVWDMWDVWDMRDMWDMWDGHRALPALAASSLPSSPLTRSREAAKVQHQRPHQGAGNADPQSQRPVGIHGSCSSGVTGGSLGVEEG